MKLPHLTALLSLCCLLVFAVPPVRAQVQGPPPSIDYQGKALDSQGAVLSPGAATNYTMQFRIYDAPTGTNIIWSESQVVTVKDGLFSVRIGEGNPIPANGGGSEGSLNPRDLKAAFNSSARYLGVTINIPGQSPGEITPRLAFLAAPFAMVSQRAVLADSATTAAGADVARAVSQPSGSSTFDGATFNSQTITGTQTVNGAATFAAPVNAVSVTATGAGGFSGSGANLTNLNADNLLTGTVPDARISSNFAHTDKGQTWSGSNSFTGSLFCAAVNASSFAIPSGNGSYSGNGASLTNLNPASLSAIVPDAKLPANIVRTDVGTNSAPQTITGAAYFNHNEASFGGTEFYGLIRLDQTNAHITDPVTRTGPFWQMFAHPNGDLYLQATSGNGGIISRDGGGFHSFSDARLKKDITPVTGVLDRVLKMQAVSFRFKTSSEDAQKVIGFVAQDVEPLFPEVVGNKDEYKTMAYSELIPVTITAVQEEHKLRQESDEEKQAEIDALRRQNKELESRLNTIGKRLDSLDKRGRH